MLECLTSKDEGKARINQIKMDGSTTNGQLAAATGVDVMNWMYPVAFGFFQSETLDNWEWFMNHLRKAIGDPPILAICSDACKGLMTVVKNVFP